MKAAQTHKQSQRRAHLSLIINTFNLMSVVKGGFDKSWYSDSIKPGKAAC